MSVKGYVSEGIVETFDTADRYAAGIYYMPHTGVWKPQKKVPLRIVFDASSKRRGHLSLNDVIRKGESFVNRIHDILTSSRFKKIVLMCDIESAFTQIRLIDAHKDLCRFLWLRNVNHPPTKDNVVEYRFRRLPFGVTACPSILNMAILSYLESQNSELSTEIAKNLYVDNILLQAESVPEAVRKYKESKYLFSKIGMNLREYISNSEEVNSRIPYSDKLQSGSMKILGVDYNTITDNFTVRTKFVHNKKLNKRDVVSQINSIYDPIGLTGPLMVKLKSMMREIFDSKVDWKTPLDQKICDEWYKLCKEVDLATLSIPSILSAVQAKIEEVNIVSDSEIALYWIKSSKKVPVFVANQGAKILSIKQQLDNGGATVKFFHVSTENNPADAGTRGLTAQEIIEDDWIKGPRWLENHCSEWPIKSINTLSDVHENDEIKTMVTTTLKVTTSENKQQEQLIDLKRFSKIDNVLRVLAKIAKTMKNWVAKTNQNRSSPIKVSEVDKFDNVFEITASDMVNAERFLISHEHRSINLDALKKRFHDKLIIRDEDGIIRHHSRLQNASIPYDTKSPIYIPEDSELSRLIVQDIHIKTGHSGKEHTLSIARQRFWISRPSYVFKKFLKGCVICKKIPRSSLRSTDHASTTKGQGHKVQTISKCRM
ncbi:hypothetical protein RB195_025059 [Necator americanus]|uniref:Integrase zinc-binding domain-containing protein n=1 Tax=Necator americanus TaxID=51031 RepID=A0ABR1EQR4_NECAM